MDFVKFQTEHAAWLDSMYPNQPPEFPAAGMVEEAGELMHALLKNQQQSVWGEERRYAGVNWHESIIDAIGDCAIYACSLCNTMHWDFAEMMFKSMNLRIELIDSAFEQVANLLEASIKVLKGVGHRHLLLAFIMRLCSIARTWGIDISEAIDMTWQKVSKRSRT